MAGLCRRDDARSLRSLPARSRLRRSLASLASLGGRVCSPSRGSLPLGARRRGAEASTPTACVGEHGSCSRHGHRPAGAGLLPSASAAVHHRLPTRTAPARRASLGPKPRWRRARRQATAATRPRLRVRPPKTDFAFYGALREFLDRRPVSACRRSAFVPKGRISPEMLARPAARSKLLRRGPTLTSN